jgi:hypothetical protein
MTNLTKTSREAAVRPKTIVYFERIIFGTLLVGVLQSYLHWDRIVQAASLHNFSVAPVLIRLIFISGWSER